MKHNRIQVILPLIALLLAAQACVIPTPDWNIFHNLDRILCTNLTGKQWVEDGDGGQCVSLPENPPDQEAVSGEDPDQEFQPQGSQEPVYADPASCNAYSEVSLRTTDPEKSETSNETKCVYSLYLTNNSKQTVWIFLHEHNTFMNNEEEKKWDNYLNLSPGESKQIKADYTVRKSDQAVSAHILDQTALIYATEGCINTFKNNNQAKELIAAEMPILCGP